MTESAFENNQLAEQAQGPKQWIKEGVLRIMGARALQPKIEDEQVYNDKDAKKAELDQKYRNEVEQNRAIWLTED
jgi:hypothetical protein